jgi:hypothetical protein
MKQPSRFRPRTSWSSVVGQCAGGRRGSGPAESTVRDVTSLTERGGANLEHRYELNYAEQRPTELKCTAVTGGFSISAGHVPMRTSLGVKGSQVQILSSRRRDRAAFSAEDAARFVS